MPTVHTTRASGCRVPPRDLAERERALRSGEERVAPHRDRRRPRVRRLADEAQHVALDAEGAEHDAGRLVHRLEHGPLLDVQLEIRARVDRLQLAACASRMRSSSTPFSRSASTSRMPCLSDERPHVVELQAAAGRRGSKQAPAESRALFVGPVDELERDRRPAAV